MPRRSVLITLLAALLLQAGADPAIRNVHDMTALDFALAHNWKDKGIGSIPTRKVRTFVLK